MENLSRDWEHTVGQQIRHIRLRQDQTQAQLAGAAGISLTALRHLETGRGATLSTLVKVLRALGQVEWLKSLAPTPTVSPMDMLRQRQKAPRQRAYVARTKHTAKVPSGN
ncbi:MAG: helix-turn-helix domain-containing protein [Acidiferrobacter sp.]